MLDATSVWRRDPDRGWIFAVETDLDAAVAVPEPGVPPALRGIHDRATRASGTRFHLVWPDTPER